MNNQKENTLQYGEFAEKHPFEECNEEDYNKEKTHQIEFIYPKELQRCLAGQVMIFKYDEENTYVETVGEWDNAGMFVHRGKRYTDIELYEYVLEFFKIQLESPTVTG
tara:strand:- start:3519 stop:3842 length:324 start_codon:yes stop_codon:yes gene_type:complete